MLLAKDIKGYGMACATELQHNITTLVSQEQITRVVETGSYLGLGTTKAVLKGMKIHEMDYKFISIEVNPENFHQAINNNMGTKAEFWNGLSIPRSLEPIDISFDVPDNIVVDHLSADYGLYQKELRFDVPDDLLRKACAIEPELIILDSAGHIGFIEFKYMLELMHDKSYWLVLDDTGHVKHYHSLQYIKENEDRFEIAWESPEDEIHRSAIIQVLW